MALRAGRQAVLRLFGPTAPLQARPAWAMCIASTNTEAHMALPVSTQMKYWGGVSAVFLVLLWFLGDVILPFVLGGAIAYFLDPVADRLEKAGCSRAVAVSIITLIAVLIFVVMALLVVPTLIE